ncbi:MAG: hypothetical protein M1835_006017 [Candelina submexicana]|nr:MAG: hypothetical protein M1835_006017 [Candelina submexicana]
MKLPKESAGSPVILPRVDLSLHQSGTLPWDPVAYCLITAFTTLSLWMVVEIHIQIWAIFKRRRGLYFWSLLATAWGVVGHTVGFLIKLFAPGCNFVVYGIIIQLGWWGMILGFSLVLYSRLHLVIRNYRIQQAVLIMIIAVYFGIQWPTTIIFFGYISPKYSKAWAKSDEAMEKVQVIVVSIAESIIEGIYIWATLRLLKPGINVRPRKVLILLITVSSLNMLSNIMLIIMDYTNIYVMKAAIHGWVYTIKLRLEFVVLNQLMAIASKGLAPSGTAASPAKSGHSDHHHGSLPTSYTNSQPDSGLGLTKEVSPDEKNQRMPAARGHEQQPGALEQSWFHSFAESEKSPRISKQNLASMPSVEGMRNNSVATGSTVVPPVPSLRGDGSLEPLSSHQETRNSLGDVARARRALNDKMMQQSHSKDPQAPFEVAGSAPHLERGFDDKTLPETPPAIQDVIELPQALDTGDTNHLQASPLDAVHRPQSRGISNTNETHHPHRQTSARRPPLQNTVPPTAVLPPEILAGPPQPSATATPIHHLWPRRTSSRGAPPPSRGLSSPTSPAQHLPAGPAGFGTTPSARMDPERAVALEDNLPGLFAGGERRASVGYIGAQGLAEVADDDDEIGLQMTEFY